MSNIEIINIYPNYQVYLDYGLWQQFIANINDKMLFIVDKNLDLNIPSKYVYQLEVNEEVKNLTTIKQLYDFYLTNNVCKDNYIVAIGGGCLLDIVGFSASSFKRGIPLIYIPTTLLAMVDACIGGKNGVNFHDLKNYIGTFYNPQAVIIDPCFLKTLPLRQINNGFAEIIKYGCIYDKDLLLTLLNEQIDIKAIIKKSLLIKNYFISEDFLDNNKRHALNFGHTYGHAIESYYHFQKYLHGEAISIGMNLMYDDPLLKAVCQKFNLPIKLEKDIDLTAYLIKDKKNINDSINFVTLKTLGEVNDI